MRTQQNKKGDKPKNKEPFFSKEWVELMEKYNPPTPEKKDPRELHLYDAYEPDEIAYCLRKIIDFAMDNERYQERKDSYYSDFIIALLLHHLKELEDYLIQ